MSLAPPALAAAATRVFDREAAIGVFDSGIGGLSILRALRRELPAEHMVYLADTAHAPYGERGEDFVRERSLAITRRMLAEFGIKALVIACNTATACAIDPIRSAFPGLPVVGVEPALKPALQASRTRRIGVIGTRATLASRRFGALLQAVSGEADFIVQACDGLASAIERAVRATPADTSQSASEIEAICAYYIRAIGIFGSSSGEMDTLVLGCTHYPFAERELRLFTGPEARLIEPGGPVAKQARRLLERGGMLRLADAQTASGDRGPAEPTRTAEAAAAHNTGTLQLVSTADPALLQAAAQRWL